MARMRAAITAGTLEAFRRDMAGRQTVDEQRPSPLAGETNSRVAIRKDEGSTMGTDVIPARRKETQSRRDPSSDAFKRHHLLPEGEKGA